MRLLANGFSTAETTLVGTTAGGGGGIGTAAPISNNLRIQRLVVMVGGSTVAPNTSGLVHFRHGQSSDAIASTIILPTPVGGDVSSQNQPVPVQWELDGLNIEASWFEFATQEAGAGGVSVFVFGE